MRILRGEVWRTVTALTLHVDLAHVLGNAAACAILIPPVGQALGPGTGVWVLLLSGALGNALTALVHGAPARWRGRAPRRRPWVVIVASLVLLVLLGTAEGSDVLGHCFGLLAGTVLGLAVSLARPHPFAKRVEWVLVAGALGLVVACWRLA